MPRTLRISGIAMVAACALLLAVLGGCAPKGPTFVQVGSLYTTQTVTATFARAQTAELAAVSVDKAAQLRHAALVGLRSRGASGSATADLITSVLGSEPRAVPVYVELASVDGTPVVVVVEASGPSGGVLDHKRLWVLDDKGNVIFAGSR